MPSESRLAQWARAVLLNSALLMVAIAIAVGIAEAAVRWLVPQQLVEARPDIWEPADSLGWIFRPSISTTINTGDGTVHVYTDSRSMRVGAAGASEAPTRVLLIGDSFLAALQVEYEQSVAGLLGPLLSARLNHPVAIRNAGVAGWDPPQYLIRGRRLLATEQHRAMVIALYLGNDIVPARRDYTPPLTPTPVATLRVPTGLTAAELVDAILRPLNDALEQRSHLFVLLKNRFSTLRMRLGLTADYFPPEFTRAEATGARWDVTADLCAELIAEARRQGTPALVVLVPTPWQVYPSVFAEYVAGFGIDPSTVDLDQPNRLMAERFAERGVTMVDPLPVFRAAAGGGAQLFGRADKHLSIGGNALLADQMIAPITELLSTGASRQAGR